MRNWYETLEGLWGFGWQHLSGKAVKTVLSTLGTSGAPEARMVVIRAANPRAATVSMHTDTATVKMRELARDPRAALHVWSETDQLQLRLRGTIRVLTGEQAAPYWPDIPDMSRSNYGVDPAPGTVIPASDAYARVANPDRFAVLILTLSELDIVHLSDDYHRRAVFTRKTDWAGQWLAP